MLKCLKLDICFGAFLVWFSLLLLGGCSKSERDPILQIERIKINFSTDLTQSKAASDPFTGVGLNHTIKQFGVFALLNGSLPYVSNLIVSRETTNAPWRYSPELYWPDAPLDFYAYAHNDPFSGPRPSSGDADDVVGFRDVRVSSGVPKIFMIVDSYPHFQIDLLLADAQKGKTKTVLDVRMPFKHMMTRITFSAKAKLDPGTPSASPAKITDIIIRNVYDTGEIEMDAAKEWVVDTLALKRKYWLHILETENGNKELNDLDLTTSYQQLSTLDGVLLLMPQTLPNDALIELRYVLQSDQLHTITIPLQSITPRWVKGTAINYQIEIDNALATP